MTKRIILGAEGNLVTLKLGGSNKKQARALLNSLGYVSYDRVVNYCVCPIRETANLIQALRQHNIVIHPTQSLKERLLYTAKQLRWERDLVRDLIGDLTARDYQHTGIGFLWKKPSVLLGDDMGLGKSMQFLLSTLPLGQAMVLCPASLKYNWLAEVKKWRSDMTPIVIHHRHEFRYPERGEVLILSHGLLPGTALDFNRHGMPWPGTHLGADEAHMLFNPRSKRTASFRLLRRRIHKKNGYVVLMTGTPFRNKLQELWTTLVNLDLGKRTYGSFKNFARLTGGIRDPNNMWGCIWKPNLPAGALDPLKPYVLRREKRDVLKDLPPKSRALYELGPLNDRDIIESFDSLDINDVLDHINGSRSLPDLPTLVSSARARLSTIKLNLLMPLIEEYEFAETPLVVFSAHRDPIIQLGKRKNWGCIHGGISTNKRQPIVDRFQEGICQNLAMTIQTGGLGYNLTNSSNAIFIDQVWVPSDNRQAEDRLARIGQTNRVQILVAVVNHPLDYRVSKLLNQKIALEEGALKLITTSDQSNNTKLAVQLEKLADLI